MVFFFFFFFFFLLLPGRIRIQVIPARIRISEPYIKLLTNMETPCRMLNFYLLKVFESTGCPHENFARRNWFLLFRSSENTTYVSYQSRPLNKRIFAEYWGSIILVRMDWNTLFFIKLFKSICYREKGYIEAFEYI